MRFQRKHIAGTRIGTVLNFLCCYCVRKLLARDRRERIDPNRYTVADLEGVTSGRMPGEVDGEQFIIRNCKARLAMATETNCAVISVQYRCLF